MLLTGGSSGIGRAIAAAWLERGGRLWLTARERSRAERAARELESAHGRQGGSARGFELENADPGSRAALAAEVAAGAGAHGPLQAVVLNAGWIEPHGAFDAGLASAPEAEPLRAHLEADFLGPALLVQALGLERLAAGPARLLAIVSAAGFRGFPGIAGYVAAKHALLGWVRALAIDLETQGIAVGALCPYYVETEMLIRAIQHRSESLGQGLAEARAEFARRNPGGRLISPAEVAAAALEFIDRPSSGRVLVLDGGPPRELHSQS
jgi:NAD(P)-dependent dehydrogenase (short-subunit alcohol dehydrogenase family)